MSSERVFVRQVKGRYPQGKRRLDSDNIEAQIEEVGQLVRILLEDSTPGHEEAFLEIVLEVLP